MALGELQLSPDEFWQLTGGELSAKMRGFSVLQDMESANHRNLLTLMANINRRKGSAAKEPKDIWPLDIDFADAMDMDERLNLYNKIGRARKNGI